MSTTEQFVDDLRRQADIVRIVSGYIQLKKKGTNYMSCCPFHKEKTPSFSVSPAKNIFYCFGCQKGGSVYDFVMEIERVSFWDSVKIVAEKTGVEVPKTGDEAADEIRKREMEECRNLNLWALEWWRENLKEGRESEVARNYLDSRGVTKEGQETFLIGFAPESWEGLTVYLTKRGASAAQLERSGLVVKKEAGGFYDRFRGRVIFPILDSKSRPIAFGGRALSSDQQPKYLNSPETPLFTKGQQLYGLAQSAEEIRKKRFAILVEGYLDLITLYQNGVRNVVASLGTALTKTQVKLLGRFAHRVVVNYDGDKAGILAARRAVEALLAEEFEVKVLVLPKGADPDQFVKEHGVAKYNDLRSRALPHIQFIIGEATRNRNLHQPEEKAEAVEEVLPSIQAVRNQLLKREYFDMAMDSLRVENDLRKSLWKSVRTDGSFESKPFTERLVPKLTDLETRLLELLVRYKDLREMILPRIAPEDYELLASARLFEALKSQADRELDLGELCERFQSETVVYDLLGRIIEGDLPVEGESGDDFLPEAESCLNALSRMKIERRLEVLSLEISAAQRAEDTESLNRLVMERLELSRLRNLLLSNTRTENVSITYGH
jgi:DNA primase